MHFFYGFSRITFVLGIACMLMSVFFGHFKIFKSIFSGSNVIIISKSIVIGSIMEVVMIELLYCTNAIPDGMYITFWICIILAFGLLISTTFVSVIYMALIEYPFTVCINSIS